MNGATNGMGPVWLLTIAALVLGIALSLTYFFAEENPTEMSASRLDRGRAIYMASCASCHGARLEGQPDWKTRSPTGRLRAPPHDASGHTWHHPDSLLFRITKEGPAAVVGGGYESDMPGFADVLLDSDIMAVLDFIKSTWPERERRYQAEVSRQETDARR